MEWNDDGDGAGALAVGMLVVRGGVLDPIVAVGVHLRDAPHAAGA